jgi:hypothetical protein
MKKLKKLPDFPKNEYGLIRGTILEGNNEAVRLLGLEVGEKIPIGYDGEFIRCGGIVWSINRIMEEIKKGWWIVVGRIDLSNLKLSKKFAKDIELIEVEE